jgi:hypothetical protein
VEGFAAATAVLLAPDSRLQSKASRSPLEGFYRIGDGAHLPRERERERERVTASHETHFQWPVQGYTVNIISVAACNFL